MNIIKEGGEKVPFSSWYSVFILMIVYIFSMIDRQIISLIIGDIQNDLHINDFQAGLLMGPAFGLFYIIGGPLFGMAVDRAPRRAVLSIGLGIWSLAATCSGLASSFVQLVIARTFVGAGEASVAPSSYSIISDLFDKGRVAFALSIFAIGGTVGGGASLLIGGLILGWLGASDIVVPMLGTFHPWQIVFIMTGAPGLLLILLIWTVKDPRPKSDARALNGDRVNPDRPPLAPFLRSHKRLLASHFLAFGLAGTAAYSVAHWSPELLSRAYGWSKISIGASLGLVTIGTSIASHIVSGWAIDKFYKRGMLDAHFRVYIWMLLPAIPLVISIPFLNSAHAFIGVFLALHLFAIPFTAFASSSLQIITPPRLRGVISGMFLAFLGLVGLSIGPSAVGFVSRYILDDPEQLALSIAIVAGTSLSATVLLLASALGTLRNDPAHSLAPDVGQQGSV